jgi:hypothetical protein
MWERLASAGCASVVILALSTAAAAQGPARSPAVIVCLVLSPKLAIESRVVTTVLSEIQTIWKVLGAHVRSVKRADDNCTRIVVVKADHEALAQDLSREDALAWVPFAAGNARQLMFLRVSRARLFVAGVLTGPHPDAFKELMLGRLLGRMVAHELGHVLLNSQAHANSGLMRDHYRANDVLRVNVSAYTLNSAERARLFTNLAAGSRLAIRQ